MDTYYLSYTHIRGPSIICDYQLSQPNTLAEKDLVSYFLNVAFWERFSGSAKNYQLHRPSLLVWNTIFSAILKLERNNIK